MGQDSWNLQYGKSHPARYRRGNSVDMHPDEGYGGPKMIPGYAGAYKNAKTRVLKANGNPKSYGSENSRLGGKKAEEMHSFSLKSARSSKITGKTVKKRK